MIALGLATLLERSFGPSNGKCFYIPCQAFFRSSPQTCLCSLRLSSSAVLYVGNVLCQKKEQLKDRGYRYLPYALHLLQPFHISSVQLFSSLILNALWAFLKGHCEGLSFNKKLIKGEGIVDLEAPCGLAWLVWKTYQFTDGNLYQKITCQGRN